MLDIRAEWGLLLTPIHLHGIQLDPKYIWSGLNGSMQWICEK